jgi:hypothetical protein
MHGLPANGDDASGCCQLEQEQSDAAAGAKHKQSACGEQAQPRQHEPAPLPPGD